MTSSRIGCAYMKNRKEQLCLSAVIVLIAASLACGSGNSTSPLSAVSPTSNALVAQYSIKHFHSGLSAWVEFGTDTNYGRQTSVKTDTDTSSAEEVLNILVAGMRPQTTYHMRAHVTWTGGSWIDQDHTFTTSALPATFPVPSLTVTLPTPGLSPAPGVELLSLILPQATADFGPAVADLQGNIIWYYPFGATPPKLMDNGDMILQMGPDLREVDLAGNTIRDVSVTQVNQSLQASGYSFSILSFSHDVLVQPNGHWITIGQISKDYTGLAGTSGTTSVLGDAVVDIDLNGNVVWGWSAFDHLDVNRALQGYPDWTHSNALVYTADSNLLISMRHQSWILKLDYRDGAGSGNVLWKLGNGGDFTIAGSDPSQWFYGQHNPAIVSTNGPLTTMAVYDDGNLRVYSDGSSCVNGSSLPACYSRATIFQVDESTNLATLIWQDLPGFYSFWGGSIGTLSNGDVEFDNSDPWGAVSSQILEVTQAPGNPQVVWQMNITGEWAYRGSRIPSLYPGVTWQQ